MCEQLSIVVIRGDERVAARKEAGTQVTPETPETPEQRDARIKAFVEACKAKGGPITNEQMTEEVLKWLEKHDAYYHSQNNLKGEPCNNVIRRYFIPAYDGMLQQPSDLNLRLGQAYWNEADAKHDKWLADCQTQTTPITREQGKLLRVGDVIWRTFDNSPVVCEITLNAEALRIAPAHGGIIYDKCAYFTRAAAQAALDKQKADAADPEPPKWCERAKGLHPENGDEITFGKLDLQKEHDRTTSFTLCMWTPSESTSIWDNRIVGDGGLRARYHNPAHIEWEKRQAAKQESKQEMKPTVTPAKPQEYAKVEETNDVRLAIGTLQREIVKRLIFAATSKEATPEQVDHISELRIALNIHIEAIRMTLEDCK